MIKAVLFDMDGVLIDAREWHYEALNDALRLFGFSISRAEHESYFDGLPTKDKLRALSERKNLPLGLHALINDLKQEFTVDLILTQCRPRFQHQFALAELKQRGILTGLCTNSIVRTRDLMMEKADLARFMDVLVSAQEVERGKPAPDVYIEAMNKLGVSPEETLIVEDNEHGIAAAKAARAHFLRVSDVHDVRISTIAEAMSAAER